MSDKNKTPKAQWKPEFVSPGEAWMDHVERHHNAGAATPSYLKEKSKAIQEIEKATEAYKKDLNSEKDFQGQMKQRDEIKDKSKGIDKDVKMSR